MATEKVTTMVLKGVDLKCPSCHKKIKKLLCKFPQIRDQVFDEKQNTVTIKVVCCSPEKIRDKLSRKGGKTIKSIEIIEPPPPKPADKQRPKETPPPADKQPPRVTLPPPPPADKPPKETPPPADKKPRKVTFNLPPPPADKPPKATPPPLPPKPKPVPPPPMPIPTCCRSGYEGYGGGPCYQGYAWRWPVPWYDDYRYGPYCGCAGTDRCGPVSRRDYYSEERGCAIM